MSATRSSSAVAVSTLFLAAALVSAGCSASPEEVAAQATTASLAELQAGMPTGNPPAWYTAKLGELDYDVRTVRYERSDLLAYDVAKGPAALHIDITLDPEAGTASKIEIQPASETTATTAEGLAGPHGNTTTAATPDAPIASTADEPQASPPPATSQPNVSEPAAPPAAQTEPQQAPAEPAPAEPQPSEPEPDPVVALPAGTFIPTRLNDRLDSGVAQRGDRFSMLVPEPVSLAGIEALPAGSRIWGYVAEVEKARRPNNPGRLTLKADRIETNGATVEFEGLVTAEGERLEGDNSLREDIKEIAVGAGVGGLVGGLLGGGKGVVAGILIGGGGTFVATKGEEVRIAADTPLYVELREEVVVPVAR